MVARIDRDMLGYAPAMMQQKEADRELHLFDDGKGSVVCGADTQAVQWTSCKPFAEGAEAAGRVICKDCKDPKPHQQIHLLKPNGAVKCGEYVDECLHVGSREEAETTGLGLCEICYPSPEEIARWDAIRAENEGKPLPWNPPSAYGIDGRISAGHWGMSRYQYLHLDDEGFIG